GTRSMDKGSLLVDLPPSTPPIIVTVIPPAGAPADPDALMAHGAKKKANKRVIVHKGKDGRKSAVVNVSSPKPNTKKAKPAPAVPEAKPKAKAATAHPAPAKRAALKPKRADKSAEAAASAR